MIDGRDEKIKIKTLAKTAHNDRKHFLIIFFLFENLSVLSIVFVFIFHKIIIIIKHSKNKNQNNISTRTMVSAENRIGLYIAIPVYFLLLVAASYWAYRRSEQLKKSNKR